MFQVVKKPFSSAYQRFRDASKWKRYTVLGAIILPPLLAVALIVPLFAYAYTTEQISDREWLMNRNDTGVVLLDRDGEVFFKTHDATIGLGETIPLDDMPDHLIEALIATEDRDFYEHQGYSVRGMLSAFEGNIRNDDEFRGGSTVTQQLVKNALLTDDQTLLRKYQELSLAIAAERHYDKEEILEMYLNSVYFGEGAFGIESAAQTYFSKSAEELTLEESATLIGILPAPGSWSPLNGDTEEAEMRQAVVLQSMEKVGFLDEEERLDAEASGLSVDPHERLFDDFAMHYVEMVMDELHEHYDEEEIARSGFEVQTTLDSDWQEMAQQTVAEEVAALEHRNVSNGAAIVMEPGSGEVRALVGSRDWDQEEFGRVNAATTPRQPGSSFKPLYYAEALAEGEVTPATVLEDEPTTFGDEYEPENFDHEYYGDISVRDSLALSRNITSVEIMDRLGVPASIDAADRLGVRSVSGSETTAGLSLALGAAEVPLMEMTSAYNTFAGSGVYSEPLFITHVQDKYGDTVYAHEPETDQVLDEGAAYLISSILSDEEARSEMFGSQLTLEQEAAVKTGSTDDNRDALTLGYTPHVTVGAWVGNNDYQPMIDVIGSDGAAPIWKGVMQAVMDDLPTDGFERPDNVESMLVCEEDGLPAADDYPGATYSEYFLSSEVPDEECEAPEPQEPENGPEEDENGSEEPAEPDEPGRGGGSSSPPIGPPEDEEDGASEDEESGEPEDEEENDETNDGEDEDEEGSEDDQYDEEDEADEDPENGDEEDDS